MMQMSKMPSVWSLLIYKLMYMVVDGVQDEHEMDASELIFNVRSCNLVSRLYTSIRGGIDPYNNVKHLGSGAYGYRKAYREDIALELPCWNTSMSAVMASGTSSTYPPP